MHSWLVTVCVLSIAMTLMTVKSGFAMLTRSRMSTCNNAGPASRWSPSHHRSVSMAVEQGLGISPSSSEFLYLKKSSGLASAGSLLRKDHAFSVAPMMEYTDMHYRHLFRLLSKRAVLYTEMVTANALVRTDNPERFLEAEFGVEEPLVLQLGGSDVGLMREAARLAVKYGYRHININCGCPSPKVAGAGNFGASLMREAALVRELSHAVSEVTGEPTTVKCRIGVDDEDNYEFISAFIEKVSGSSSSSASTSPSEVNHFIVHARKALLGGKFSPADNRKIPPLKYDTVHRLCADFPHLGFTLNGGLITIEECEEQLRISDSRAEQQDFIRHPRMPSPPSAQHSASFSQQQQQQGALQGQSDAFITSADQSDIQGSSSQLDSSGVTIGAGLAGVMVGRACVDAPFAFATLDSRMYGQRDPGLTRAEILTQYTDYCCMVERTQGPQARRALVKPLLGLFAGEPNGKSFRNRLDQLLLVQRKAVDMDLRQVIMGAAEVLSAETLDRAPGDVSAVRSVGGKAVQVKL